MYSNGMFPSYGPGNNTSPTVLLNETGYRTDRSNAIETLLTIEQDFGSWVDGLKATGSISFDNDNSHTQTRYKMPDLYMAVDRNWQTENCSRQNGCPPMSYGSSSMADARYILKEKINYDKIISDKHRVSTLFYQQKDYQRTDVYNELWSIPRRNQVWLKVHPFIWWHLPLEGNFGYNGSENFPKGRGSALPSWPWDTWCPITLTCGIITRS